MASGVSPYSCSSAGWCILRDGSPSGRLCCCQSSVIHWVVCTQGTELPRRLEALREAVREEMAGAEEVSREYLRELVALIEQTQAQLRTRLAEGKPPPTKQEL